MPRNRRNDFPDFEPGIKELRRFYRSLPRLVGNMAVNFYKDSFRRQGYIDHRYQAWPKRAGRDRGGRQGRALLVQSGRLRRSIRVVRSTYDSVTVGTDVPYAQIHNEGGRVQATQQVKAHGRKAHTRKQRGRTVRVAAHSVRGHSRQVSFTIPKRQFMGASHTLNKRVLRHISRQLDRIL